MKKIKAGGLTAHMDEKTHASRWAIFKAKLFGKRVVCREDGVEATIYVYKGVHYLTDYRGVDKCSNPPCDNGRIWQARSRGPTTPEKCPKCKGTGYGGN